ncbi:hypothetical protein [Streptomyces blastmyceticus]|uniref:Uncharacterized protein n=1 Tax=Streptomyces blastmyceticus TaxID=68180 RepID=A0ABN0Y2C5_9ACTN
MDTLAGVAGPVFDNVWPRPLQYNAADVGYMIAAGVIAPVTLLGIWYYEIRYLSKDLADAMRDAIAAAFVLLYLTIVSWSAFFRYRTDKADLSPLTHDVMGNFGTLTGVVVAFFFGSNAVGKILEAAQSRGRAEDTPPGQARAVPAQHSPESSGDSTASAGG